MTINCKGSLIDISTPKVMGILNLTPDSFYDGGYYNDMNSVMSQTEKMLREGATFIDVGAYSSRPDAKDISEEEEIRRLLPVIGEMIKEFPHVLLSVDTFRASVAQKAIEAGAVMINDISAGLLDKNMMQIVGDLQVPYCMMHMRGRPQTMKDYTDYKDITSSLLQYFSERLAVARKHKIKDIIIDPGFGFAKTTDQNFELLSNIDILKKIEVPILTGISRKSMIYKTLGIEPSEALNGTTALHMIALQKGATLLRVHDVQPAIECIKLFKEAYNRN